MELHRAYQILQIMHYLTNHKSPQRKILRLRIEKIENYYQQQLNTEIRQ